MSEPPGSSISISILNAEHIEFLKTFQPAFDAFYASADARQRGAQKEWTCKHVIDNFIDRFGTPDSAVVAVRIFLKIVQPSLTCC